MDSVTSSKDSDIAASSFMFKRYKYKYDVIDLSKDLLARLSVRTFSNVPHYSLHWALQVAHIVSLFPNSYVCD